MIATTGFSRPVGTPAPWTKMLWITLWDNGLGPALILYVVGMVMLARERRWLILLPAVYVMLLICTILKDDGSGIRHKASAVIMMIVTSGWTLAPLAKRWPRATLAAVLIALLLPFCLTIKMVRGYRAAYAYDGSVDWVEQHVPAGSKLIVVAQSIMTRRPLPTPEAGDKIWGEITAPHAYEKKFDAGLARFNLTSTHYPHAFSEEIAMTERMYRRMWWILAGRPTLQIPRYQIDLAKGTVFMFGVDDLAGALKNGGTALIWKGDPNPDFGTPAAQWVSPAGSGAFVYVSPDLRPKLTNMTGSMTAAPAPQQ
jgi:hypothetical protein